LGSNVGDVPAGLPEGTSARPAPRYMPQIDGLRALAVALVFAHHMEVLAPSVSAGMALGGVKLFFVISGFLITGILLRSRADIDSRRRSRLAVLKEFYLRRTFRIFPLYYLVIGAGLVLGLEPAREIWVWLVTYTLNFYLANLGWFVANYAHFWSLAVEEQFYLVWPWVIILVPRRWLAAAIGAAVLTGPLFRYWIFVNSQSGIDTYVLPPGYLDFLGIGALVALALDRGLTTERLRVWLARLALPAALGSSVVVLRVGWLDGPIGFALRDLALALTLCWIVTAASVGLRGWAGRVLASPPLVYMGRVSYGLYVYHPFMIVFYYRHVPASWSSYPASKLVSFVLIGALTLAVSSISLHYFEDPIRRWGRRLERRPAPAPAPQPAEQPAHPRSDSETVMPEGVALLSAEKVGVPD
jgi:peptidoglycan/LPS O-acetylase OafA/YrhL